MPYKTFWYKENEIVFTEVVGEFTVAEMVSMNQEYVENYFTGDGRKIHLIADLRAMDNYPKNLAQIRDATKMTASQEGMGWIILIGTDNPFVKFMATTVFQLVRVNCKIVATLEDADDLLERVRFADS